MFQQIRSPEYARRQSPDDSQYKINMFSTHFLCHACFKVVFSFSLKTAGAMSYLVIVESWAIDNNVVTVNGKFKPHEVFCEKEIIRRSAQEDIFQ